MSLPLVIFQKNVHFQFRYSWLCCSASPSNSILGSSIKHRIKALSFYCLPSLRLLCWFFPFNFNSDCTTNDGGGGFTCRYLPRRVSKAYGTKQGLCFADSSPTRNILSLPLIGLRLRSAPLPQPPSGGATTCFHVIVLRESLARRGPQRHTLDWEILCS